MSRRSERLEFPEAEGAYDPVRGGDGRPPRSGRRLHLDDDQRQRQLEIADKCPVHRTLRSKTISDTVPA